MDNGDDREILYELLVDNENNISIRINGIVYDLYFDTDCKNRLKCYPPEFFDISYDDKNNRHVYEKYIKED